MELIKFCHLELELSGSNKEVAALYSDHYTQYNQLSVTASLLEINDNKYSM